MLITSKTWNRCLSIVALLGLSTAQTLAQPTPEPSFEAPIRIDSGLIADGNPNAGPAHEARLVWGQEVAVPDAPWMRLHFTPNTILAGEDRFNGGSYLVITSVEDGAQQFLDATTLPEWDHISAVLNGDTMIVELYAAPGMGDNRVEIEKATAGIKAGIGESICGPTDDRVPYNDPRIGRLSTGCTSFLITRNGASNEFLTAGHCINNNQVGVVVMFNVPAATGGGTFIAPPPEFQYPVQASSIQSLNNAAVGDEYARFNTRNNSNTGLSARVGQGRGAYSLAASAPASGTTATTVRGNGTVNGQAGIALVPNQWNRINKTHTGPYVGKTGTRIDYAMDTEGGNSGSPVTQRSIIPPITDRVIGIHTDGFCNSSGGINSGTAIDHPGVQNVLNNPQGLFLPYQSSVSRGITTTRFSDNSGADGGTVYFDFEVGSQSVVVTSLLLNINHNGVSSNASANEDDDFFNFEVYITPTTASGKMNDIGQWTKVADGGGMPKFEDEYTLGALKNTFSLGPNQSYGVAIVFDDAAGHAYTNATGSNEVYSNSDVKITAIGASNSKFGPGIINRVFNGGINYDLNQAGGQCLETVYQSNNAGNNGGMVYLDALVGPKALIISALSVNTAATPGSKVDVKLYRTSTTYQGKTGSSAGWTLLAEGSGTAAGQDEPTIVPLDNFARLSPNLSHGLAIQLTHDDGTVATGHRYSNGTGLNQSFADANVELTLGAATNTPFGAANPLSPRVFNGALCYGLDLNSCRSPLFSHNPPKGDITAFLSVVGGQEEADNFTVTNNWRITSGTFWGTHTNNPSPLPIMDMTIRIFENDNGLPGALVASRKVDNVNAVDTGLVMTSLPSQPSIRQYDASFSPIDLEAGSYWISALARDPAINWAWTRIDTRLDQHAFRNGGAGTWSLSSGNFAFTLCGQESLPCYPDCDKSTGIGVLDIFDFLCFQNSFVAGESYACDCDTTTGVGVCDIFDFLCFQNEFVAGCP